MNAVVARPSVDVTSPNPIRQPSETETVLSSVPPFTVRLYLSGSWSVVEAAGELDIQVVPLVHQQVREGASRLVFDLSRVTFMDASGLGILARSLRMTAQRRGCLRVAAPSRQVRKMLAITQLDRAIPVFDTLAEALTTPVE
jgi:anti-sigma B factor antagonist